MNAVIAIDGSLANASSDVPNQTAEIQTNRSFGASGAVAIHYDGQQSGETWHGDARVKIVNDSYGVNTPAAKVWRVTAGMGDLDNDGDIDVDDETAIGYAVDSLGSYASHFPGLQGSLFIHGNFQCTTSEIIDEYDESALAFYRYRECFPDDCTDFGARRCDISEPPNGGVDLSDLAMLLGQYGDCEGEGNYSPYVDFDYSGCIDLSDLATLLGAYGATYTPCTTARESGDRGTYVDLSVAAIDTGGYSGGGFSGEVDHFVFDLKIEVDDPNDDDWIVSGAVLEASNDAEFRLSAAATTPNQYATFVAAPWTSLPGSSTANVAGAYDPADPDEIFEVDEINIGWYDTSTSSHDGPATVMRIVIDVSDVSGADVSSGFGAVYFAKAKKNASDILVAELDAGACTADASGSMDTYYGSFFVNGE